MFVESCELKGSSEVLYTFSYWYQAWQVACQVSAWPSGPWPRGPNSGTEEYYQERGPLRILLCLPCFFLLWGCKRGANCSITSMDCSCVDIERSVQYGTRKESTNSGTLKTYGSPGIPYIAPKRPTLSVSVHAQLPICRALRDFISGMTTFFMPSPLFLGLAPSLLTNGSR
jgi:hypothetical protein